MILTRALFLALTALTYASFASAAPTVLRFGKIVDGTGKVIPDGVVIVDGDRVISVGPGTTPLPADARMVDLRRFTAIPGLIDLHTHMTY